MDKPTLDPEGHQRRAVADVTATLCHEQCPTPQAHMATALLDYGEGKLRIVAHSREEIDRLTSIPHDSIVRVRGRLVHHDTRITGGRHREYYELYPDSIEVLHDARAERMRA